MEKITKEKTYNICTILLFAGFIARMIYAWRVPFYISSHDLEGISNWYTIECGHLGYMQYLYLMKALPKFSPMGLNQYYQPPLFHIIGALNLGLNRMMGVNIVPPEGVGQAMESLQYINTVFSAIAALYIYRIMKYMDVKDNVLIFATAFTSFSPFLFVLGTALTNDMLMLMFVFMAIYYAIKWFYSLKISNIIKLAFCIALSMLSKTSGGFIAPGVAALFLYALIKNKDKRKMLILQFVVFGIICVPLGLSWLLRNKILFGIPFDYIPDMSTTGPGNQYIGNIGIINRIGLSPVDHIANITVNFDQPKEYANIWENTVLTSILDENLLVLDAPLWRAAVVVLKWLMPVLHIGLFVIMVCMLFDKKSPIQYKLLFFIDFIVFMVSYIIFCFKYPFVCTMNFRYIVPVHIFLLGSYCVYASYGNLNKYIIKAVNIVMTVISAVVVMLFMACAV